MTAFIITMFVVHILGAGLELAKISNNTPPLLENWLSFIATSGFAIWAGVLLLG